MWSGDFVFFSGLLLIMNQFVVTVDLFVLNVGVCDEILK